MGSRRPLVAIVAAMTFAGAGGCADSATRASASSSTIVSQTSVDPARQAARDLAQTQIMRASSDICPLLPPSVVAASFGVQTALRQSAMGEANGPACGYPNPDGHGYLLVVQFRSSGSWDATIGTPADVGGPPARLTSISTIGDATLFVQDNARNAVVVFIAPTGPPDAVLKAATHVYRGT